MDIPTSKNQKLALNDYPKPDYPKAGMVKDTDTIQNSFPLKIEAMQVSF